MPEISYSSVSMSTEEYQARLTACAHDTIKYLARTEKVTPELADELLETLVVVPINNNTLFGKVRELIFGKNSKENKSTCSYRITQLK